MDEKARRTTTWIIIVVAILAIIGIASYRKSEMDRLANRIAYGTQEQRIAAVRTLVAKQKLMEALEDRPRWVMDNVVASIPLIGDHDAYYELLTCHGVLDAPVQARDQTALTRLGRRGAEILLEAIQDKDGTTRGTAKAPLINIAKAIEADEGTEGNPVIDGGMDLLDAWDQYVRDLVRDIFAGIALPAVTDRLIPVMQQTEPGKKTLLDGTTRDQTTQEFMRARATAEAALTTMKIPAIEPIIDNLLTYSANADVRGNACRLLGTIASQAVPNIPPDDAVPVVKPLLDRLVNDPQWAVQRRSAMALGLLGQVAIDNGVVPVLIGRLSAKDEVKAAAVEALGRIGDPAAVGPLVSTLLTNRRGATSELRIALTALGDPSIPELAGALVHPDAEVRLIATEAVAEIGGPNAVVPLGQMLADSKLAVRRIAADALRDIADERVLPQVAAALGDSDWQVYHAARDALANVGPPAIPVLLGALASGNPRVSSMARDAFVRIGDPALAQLGSALSSASPSQAHWAAISLGDIGYTAVKPAAAVLSDRSKPVTARAQAALALGRTGAGDAVKPLMGALASQEAAVQIEAVKSLDKLADARATPALVNALTSKSPAVRDAAMNVLGEWRLGDVEDLLRKLTKSSDKNAARRAAVLVAEVTSMVTHELLEDLPDLTEEGAAQQAPVDVDMLEETAGDTTESMTVRTRAVRALGYAGSEKNLTPLIALLEPREPLAATAAIAVAKIGSRFGGDVVAGVRTEAGDAAKAMIGLLLDTDDDELRAIVGAGLAEMGHQPVWALVEALKTAGPKLKPWIIATLGAIGKPATDPVLEARGEAEDQQYKQWLVSALPLIGDAQALDLIDHLAEEDKPQLSMTKPGEQCLEKITEVAVR